MSETLPFNGRYTIESPKGGHKTFQIKTVKNGGLQGKRILSLFVGSDNTDDKQYKGFAFVNPQGIAVWNKDRTDANMMYANMLTSLSVHGENSQFYTKGYRLLTEKTCRKCNRVLTNPESIHSGIGPECEKRDSGKGRRKAKAPAPREDDNRGSALVEEPMSAHATPNGIRWENM